MVIIVYMAAKYCPHCGKQQPSALANFCFSCGEPLAGAKKSSAQKAVAAEIDEDGTEVYAVPNIDKLTVEVSSEGASEFASFSAGKSFGFNPDGTAAQRKFKSRRI